ncbi:MAG: protein kinase domain-containing protein [Crocinitomicaceae bacterium]
MELHEKYKILKPLGDQKVRKFGSVFLVEEKASGNRAVLKAVNKNAVKPIAVKQLRNESTFNFSNPLLPQVLDLTETETELLLVTGFKRGVPINTFWKGLKRKERNLFLHQFLKEFEKVYAELRELNIAHCDIKPSNILIERIDDKLNVSLIDFGLALRKDELDQRDLVFPLGFAAPELLLNELDLIDERTDIFAMGILIWRLYTNELPLAHPNPSIFTNLQLTHPLPEHSSIPRDVFKVLAKMCGKHQFKLPPNKLAAEERKHLLREGMNQRFNHFNEVIAEFEALKEKGSWWPFTT